MARQGHVGVSPVPPARALSRTQLEWEVQSGTQPPDLERVPSTPTAPAPTAAGAIPFSRPTPPPSRGRQPCLGLKRGASSHRPRPPRGVEDKVNGSQSDLRPDNRHKRPLLLRDHPSPGPFALQPSTRLLTAPAPNAPLSTAAEPWSSALGVGLKSPGSPCVSTAPAACTRSFLGGDCGRAQVSQTAPVSADRQLGGPGIRLTARRPAPLSDSHMGVHQRRGGRGLTPQWASEHLARGFHARTRLVFSALETAHRNYEELVPLSLSLACQMAEKKQTVHLALARTGGTASPRCCWECKAAQSLGNPSPQVSFSFFF